MSSSAITLESTPSARGQIQELNGLRGIAILWVLLDHFWPEAGPLRPLESVAVLGWVGVDLFFVISGFLITGILLDTLGDAHYFRNFYFRRALRIFPLYYLFLLLVFTIVPLAQGGNYLETPFRQLSGSPWWYIGYLGNIHMALIGQGAGYYLGPLWSLSIEEQFYIAFPPLVALLGTKHLGKFLWALIVAAPLFRAVTCSLWPDNYFMQFLATFARVDVLALGCLLALQFRTGRVPLGAGSSTMVMLVMLGLMFLAFISRGLNRPTTFCRLAGYSLIAFTFASVVLWAVLHRDRACTAVLRFGPLCYLGKLCYGLYLLHRTAEGWLLQGLSWLNVHMEEESVELLLSKVAAALVLAMVSWYCFELPLLRLKERFASARHPMQVAETPPEESLADVPAGLLERERVAARPVVCG